METCTEAAFRRAQRTDERAATRSGYVMDALELMAGLAAGADPVRLGYEPGDLPAALRAVTRWTGDPDQADSVPERDPAEPGRGAGGGTTGSGGGCASHGADPRARSDAGAGPGARARPAPSGGGAGVGGLGASKVIVRVDLEALRRGHALPGETCDIAGVGPIPVAAAREALSEAFLALLVTKGRDVASVAHAGRRADAWQRTALEWALDTCATRGCGKAANREIDHSHDWVETHYTFLATLRGVCKPCHRKRTRERWAYVGEPDAYGKVRLVPPSHPDHPDHTTESPPRPEIIRPTRARAGPDPPPDLDDDLPLGA